MAEAPVGDVALVFTHISGARRLWEHAPQAMDLTVEQHHALARQRLAFHGGYEVKTERDALMLAFADPAAAARWCLDMQERLALQAWPGELSSHDAAGPAPGFNGPRVAMGAHLGRPYPRTDPITGRMDYFGPMVNRAARVSSAAHGGQVLVSRELFLATGGLFVGRDHGDHCLKGLADPVGLVELRSPQLVERSFPPPRTSSARRSNLPERLPQLVGRRRELRELGEILAGADRCLTLLGPGGIGKTRLVRELAVRHLSDFAGGAWFCDLTEVQSAEGTLSVVARSLGIPLTAAGALPALEDQVGRAIDGRGDCLVVLDSFEQVTDVSIGTVDRFLDLAPRARFVITSRERLQLDAERVFEVGPLGIDAAASLLALRVAEGGLHLDDEHRPQLTRLARDLDGLPLAIELAAARVARLGVDELQKGLEEHLHSLVADDSGRFTLRGVLDWSWDSLELPERDALAQSAVFLGGFTLEDAEAVIDLEAHAEAPWVMDVIESLRDKSLLVPWESDLAPGEPRFTLYNSVWYYAAEKLEEQGREQAERRHGAWFSDRGQELLGQLDGPGARGALDALTLIADNLLAVHRRGLESAPEQSALAALALEPLLMASGPMGQLLELLLPVAERPELAGTTVGARVRLARGLALRGMGRLAEADRDIRVAEQVARERGEDELLAKVLRLRAFAAIDRQEHETAARALDEMMKLAVDLGNDRIRMSCLGAQGVLLHGQQRFEEAERAFLQALELSRGGQDVTSTNTLGNLAVLYLSQGRSDEAQATLSEALELCERTGAHVQRAFMLSSLGCLQLDRFQLRAAEATFLGARQVSRDIGRLQGVALATANLALVYLAMGVAEVALEHIEEAMGLVDPQGSPVFGCVMPPVQAACLAALDRLDEAAEVLDTVSPRAHALGNHAATAMIGVAWGLVEVGRARAGMEGARHAAQQRLDAAALVREDGHRDLDRAEDVRVLAELLRRGLAELD